jgi:protein TonB
MALSAANLGAPGAGGASSPLAWAVTASIALHVALIAGLPELWSYSRTPATTLLNARLEPGMPASIADVAPVSEPAKQSQPPVERATVRRPSQVASSAPRPRARQEAAELVEPTPPASPLEQAAVPPAAGAGGPASGEPTLAPHPGDDALDLGSLAQYRLALIGAAKRHRLYPEHAIERGWQGRVTVRLAFGADGALAEALVSRSSGHGSLDRQAVEMLRKAAALTPLPPALRSREFSVEVPVLFELRAAG